jgi:cell fate (sporulation/competence/biofilm development) regulator YlbF (YheA/YmcA/DUF963 family)
MKWEYRVESVTVTEKWSSKRQAEEFQKLNEQLNELGKEGWEMISYESIPMMGSLSKNVKGYSYLVFFKRQTS